ncbi:MFS transporter [Enterococcus cecorum]|uniref:MFS transporter n=1 Tax=Enterococcus cecorum TaxID=44008 RepID=A0AAW9JVS0_9ENTE|nr:MFS transporter [Enterococcus cecorum]MCJ0572316.1 MFS transporter [Enterococcus cecorum]MCJ0578318.1 MFS transporter [Enterococcus cecorum]MCJ0582024.1 MFS transporter [Enterococcus cecorum]MCJ0584622.1 MFS transporter [Enterococcus cecorum]MCJ0590334.1 MFS transporter [Enterococcus cecorum]
MKSQKNQSLLFKISLLSISLFLMMAPQISAALPLMYNEFAGVGKAGVETLSTIPNFGIILGLVISPLFIRWIGQKFTVILGLLVTLFAGTLPIYVSAYMVILLSRLFLGVGIGLFNSLAVSLIPQFFKEDEEELATMLGFQNVMGAVGAAISSFLVGYLVTLSWHAAFAIYLLVIPALILFLLFIPNDRANHVQAEQVAHPNNKVNGKVILIAGLMFVIFVFFMPMAYKLPILITQEGLGNLTQAALLAGISSLLGIPLGASFGYFFKILHDKIFPLGFILLASGFAILTIAPNLIVVFIGMVLLGFGSGLAIPYMYNWLAWAAPEKSMNLATTIVLVMVNIGCFLSPYIINTLTAFFGNDSPRMTMFASTLAFIALAVYAIAHYIRVHRVSVSQ